LQREKSWGSLFAHYIPNRGTTAEPFGAQLRQRPVASFENIFTGKPRKSVACVEIEACKNSSSISMLLSKLLRKKDIKKPLLKT